MREKERKTLIKDLKNFWSSRRKKERGKGGRGGEGKRVRERKRKNVRTFSIFSPSQKLLNIFFLKW